MFSLKTIRTYVYHCYRDKLVPRNKNNTVTVKSLSQKPPSPLPPLTVISRRSHQPEGGGAPGSPGVHLHSLILSSLHSSLLPSSSSPLPSLSPPTTHLVQEVLLLILLQELLRPGLGELEGGGEWEGEWGGVRRGEWRVWGEEWCDC